MDDVSDLGWNRPRLPRVLRTGGALALATAVCMSCAPMPSGDGTNDAETAPAIVSGPSAPVQASLPPPRNAQLALANASDANRGSGQRLSRTGLRLITSHEGLRRSPYTLAGTRQIGYGHLIRSRQLTVAGGRVVDLTRRITREEANLILQKDVRRFEKGVAKLVKVPLTQGQFDALVSFGYNVGLGRLKNSTLLKLLNRGEYDAAGEQLLSWTKAGGRHYAGLAKRRRDELARWRAG